MDYCSNCLSSITIICVKKTISVKKIRKCILKQNTSKYILTLSDKLSTIFSQSLFAYSNLQWIIPSFAPFQNLPGQTVATLEVFLHDENVYVYVFVYAYTYVYVKIIPYNGTVKKISPL